YYSQEGYMLASHADKVMMHDQGSLILVGYGRYRTYYKSFLEKIKATSNVFRVGTFKSAVEPYLRDDMSDAAKEANSAYLSSLWGAYVKEVADARGLSQDVVLAYANDFNAELSNAKGDLAEAAQNAGFIDQIGSREDMRATLVEMFGSGDEDDSDFKNVTYKKYLTALGEKETTDAPDVGIVTVAGTIVDGEADAGEAAGGDSVASLLKKARKDDNVKAVVLRVDSPGGSSFASEIIRDELIAIKDAGKPVVVSMGSLAASGGYWVSAPADEIWAAPETITGSIGVFAFLPTFENTAAEIGISIDGVGTTPLSSITSLGLAPIDENVGDLLQQSVEHIYGQFLELVADGRNLTPEYVNSIGQGRVWIGETAVQNGLVDKLGTIDDAVAAAASLAELSEYDSVNIIDNESPFDAFFTSFGASVVSTLGLNEERDARRASFLRRIVWQAKQQLEFFDEFNDPYSSYARCLSC
ncbi:MAG: signal peptide peptidase SppA, partial [Pseudomonadota bacterium]